MANKEIPDTSVPLHDTLIKPDPDSDLPMQINSSSDMCDLVSPELTSTPA